MTENIPSRMKAKTLTLNAYLKQSCFNLRQPNVFFSTEIHEWENLNKWASLVNNVEGSRLQGKLGKQKFHIDGNKVFELVITAPRETSKKITESVRDTAKAIELKREELKRAMNEIDDTTLSLEGILRKASHFFSCLVPALTENFKSNSRSQFLLR